MTKSTNILNKPFHRKNEPIDPIQEELAKMYLKTSGTHVPKKKARWQYYIAAVGMLALAAAIIIVISRSSINVKVTVLSETPSISIQDGQSHIGKIPEKVLLFVAGSAPNTYIVKNESFLGDARIFSRKARDEIVLCNSRGAGWANYTIELNEPIDFRQLDINYTARGQTGDEHLVLVMVDSDNKTYRMGKDLSSTLMKDWKDYKINLGAVRNAIDLSSISVVRFEFGSLTAGNSSATTIFLKDIYLTRAKKWL